MIYRDSWEHQYFIVAGEILGFVEDGLLRKHLSRMLSRTKVRGSKTIRHRRRLHHKPCRLEIGSR